ncbi:polysaccharide deacetylase family protein [Fodinicola acaciae]|uniref:polysaccharide deacetylase family protein n=1 Tax=Fodinicola acaciae TaxID=2681555 RepID=UPI0013D058E7|nr:polysaccharide deacetylase family protein [Fodinicola acaciae]
MTKSVSLVDRILNAIPADFRTLRRRVGRHGILFASVIAALVAVGGVLFAVVPASGTYDLARPTSGKVATHVKPPDGEDPGLWITPHAASVPTTGPLPRISVAAPPAASLKLDEAGPYAPVVTRIPTNRKVVFVTMDDGSFQDPSARTLFRQSRLPATLFLISHTTIGHKAYFRDLVAHGGTIESHTLTHPKLAGRSETFQHGQLCGAARQLAGAYGKRPTLFRPPYGSYDETTLKVAHDCQYRAVVLWEGSMIGGALYIGGHEVGPKNPLKPGMILLMHFTPRFNADYRVLLATIAASGYSVGNLSDYVK